MRTGARRVGAPAGGVDGRILKLDAVVVELACLLFRLTVAGKMHHALRRMVEQRSDIAQRSANLAKTRHLLDEVHFAFLVGKELAPFIAWRDRGERAEENTERRGVLHVIVDVP